MTRKGQQTFFALLTILLWASCYIAMRMGSAEFSPYALTCLRMLASAATILVMFPFYKPRLPALRDLPLFLLSSLLAYSLYCLFMSLGAQTVTASVSSFITALSPVLAPVFALLLLKEQMRRLQWISVGVAALGVAVMLFSDTSFSIELGVLWVLTSAIMFAGYNIVQRLLLRRYTGFEVTAWSTLLGALVLLPFLPRTLFEMRSIPLPSTLVVCYLGAVSAIAYLFWAMALRLAEHTGEVTNFMFLTPLLTTVLGFVTIGELPPISAYLGGGLMLLGLALTNVEPKKHAIEQQAALLSEELPPNEPPLSCTEEQSTHIQ